MRAFCFSGLGSEEKDEPTISRVLSRVIIHLGCLSPNTSSNLPGNSRGPRVAARLRCFPIWSCSGRGLPCRSCCHLRGGLLPHLFTLTCATEVAIGGSALCCTFHRLAPPRRYLASCPAEPGLSSTRWHRGASAQRLLSQLGGYSS